MTSAAELRVVDFDGLSMTGTQFEGCFLVDFDITAQFPLETVLSEAPEDFPTFVRGDPGDKVIPLHVTIQTGSLTPTQILALIDTLKDVFSPFRDPVFLRVDDVDGNTRRMLVKSLGLTPWETHTGSYVASLEAMEPIWEADAPTTVNILMSGTVAAAGYDFTITNEGNAMAVPDLISLTPSGSKGNGADLVRKRNITIAWRSPLEGVDSLGLPYPVDIVDHAWNTATEVGAGELLASGDDIRVLLDGVEIDRYLDDMNTTGTAVWSSIPFQPAKVAAVETAMGAAATPANGESLNVNNPEGTAGFPETGVILIDDEAIYYGSRSPFSFDNVERAYWGTTGATHLANALIHWVEHEIVLLTDFSAAGSPLARADREPMVDRTQSTNRRHFYGNTPTGSGLIAPGTLRTGQWIRELRSDGLAAPFMRMQQGFTGQIDIDNLAPTGDLPNFDSTALYVPCFLPTVPDGIVLTYQVQHNTEMEIILVDDGGFESRLTLEDVREGSSPAPGYIAGEPAANIDAGFQPLATSSRITITGRSRVVTGRRGGTVQEGVGAAGDRRAQTFTLASQIAMRSFCFDVTKDGGSTRTLVVEIIAFDSGFPDNATRLSVQFVIATADIPVGLPAAPVTCFFEEIGDLIRLPAGIYVVRFSQGTGAGVVQVMNTTQGSQYPGGDEFDESAVDVWDILPLRDINFNIETDEGVQQADADVETGQRTSWRNVGVELKSDTIPSFVLGARFSMWFFQATLENLTTGETLTLFYPLEVDAASILRIFTQAHTVFPSNGTEPAQPSLWAVEPDALALWLSLDPGDNLMRYTEPTIPAITPGNVDLAISFRDRWT